VERLHRQTYKNKLAKVFDDKRIEVPASWNAEFTSRSVSSLSSGIFG